MTSFHEMLREEPGCFQASFETQAWGETTRPMPARAGDGQKLSETQSSNAVAQHSPQGGLSGHCPDETHLPSAGQDNSLTEGGVGHRTCEARSACADTENSGHEPGGAAIMSTKPSHQTQHPAKSRRKAGRSAKQLTDTIVDARSATIPGNGDADGHLVSETQPRSAVSDQHDARFADPLILTIQQTWRRRQQWHRAEKSLTLQCSAICRGVAGGSKTEAAKMLKRIEEGRDEPGDINATIATGPLLAARSIIRAERLATEKTLEKLAKQLPVWPWVKGVHGCGAGSLAAIVGEAGDLTAYEKGISGIRKRMGLAVIGRERQRKKSGAAAFEHGYSPRRRSVMWNIGGGLIGGMGKGPRLLVGQSVDERDDLSPYQRLFVERIRYEADRNPEMLREPTTCPKTGLPRESFSKHAASRAKRYVEKRFLRDLYAAWRAAAGTAHPA